MDDPPGPLTLFPGMTAGAAARAVLLRQAAALAEGLGVTILTEDPEGPHGARVALRRLRAAFWTFRPALRRRTGRRLEQECRALFRQLGPVRDAEVLARAHDDAAEAPALAARAAALRDRLRGDLAADRALALPGRIAAFAMDGQRRGPAPGQPAADLAQARLEAAWQDCLRHGEDLRTMPDEDLHELRKAAKKMRYVAEFVAPVWPGQSAEPWIRALRQLQDGLGAVCDDLMAARHGLTPDAAAAAARREAAATLWSAAAPRRPFWRDPPA